MFKSKIPITKKNKQYFTQLVKKIDRENENKKIIKLQGNLIEAYKEISALKEKFNETKKKSSEKIIQELETISSEESEEEIIIRKSYFRKLGRVRKKVVNVYGGHYLEGCSIGDEANLSVNHFNFLNEDDEGMNNHINSFAKLIRLQKEIILKLYLDFSSEKELLKDLISSHLNLKMRKDKHSKDTAELYEDLGKKLTEEEMKKVNNILDECDKLIEWELKLIEKIVHKKSLIKEVKKELPYLNIEINEKDYHTFNTIHYQAGCWLVREEDINVLGLGINIEYSSMRQDESKTKRNFMIVGNSMSSFDLSRDTINFHRTKKESKSQIEIPPKSN